MSTKLVSFIGVGRLDREENAEAYLRTAYDFGGGKIIETAVFFDALMESKEFRIDECLLIGTETSSWATLLDKDFLGAGKFVDLYEQLELARMDGVPVELLQRLSKVLSAMWEVPVKCLAHPYDINAGNAGKVVQQYLMHVAQGQPDHIIADITHGFRTMPVMLMTALHFQEALSLSQTEVTVVYGEFRGKQSSPVRRLESIWQGVHISRAVRLFFEKFEPSYLHELTMEFWPKGAKAILSLGATIQSNYLTRLDKALAELKNALAVPPESEPPWFQAVHERLRTFYNRIMAPPHHHLRILLLADLLAERHLYGQAVTTLQLAFEAFLFHFYMNDNYGDYEETKKLRKEFINSKALDRDFRGKCIRLNAARNVIAHGGAQSMRGGEAQHQSLPSQFDSYRKTLDRLFDKFDTTSQ